ncbi:MAG: SAM-dependent chlorinase/fluorinase [Fimbriimonadaceae bacterium]|nr:SAM-dependent chlorinase/fluorinase [Fimbriimonadaceae bacterium]
MRITLLTDFGDRDGYVGAMKGVIASRAPNVTVVDIAHHVPAGDVRHAAHVLGSTAPFFPAGTVHVVVVDPGVGTARRPIAVVVDDQVYVAPDNGVLSDVLAAAAGRVAAVLLSNSAFFQQPVSSTFHGRDIFAPVAAHLAAGVPLSAFGESLEAAGLTRLESPQTSSGVGWVAGQVTYLDTFGNAVTNLSRRQIATVTTEATTLVVDVDDPARLSCPLVATYGQVADGELAAVIGSCGRLELAVNGGHAASRHGLQPGVAVKVRLR